MEHKKISAGFLKTISWLNENIIDWANAGRQYDIDGKQTQLCQYFYAYSFDGAITSVRGEYAFIIKSLVQKAYY